MKYTLIKKICLNHKSTNPIEIAMTIMDNPDISIHGPEHHALDGASLLTALYNVNPNFNLEEALDELIERGKLMPGATCGKWGVCGSVSSIGAALSIYHHTGPLSNDEYYKDHMELTSKILDKMSKIGGPRCCKRNAFLSLSTACEFIRDKYNIALYQTTISCHYSLRNKQCICSRCPYYK